MYKKKNFAKSLTTNNPLAIDGVSLGVTTGEGVKFPAVGATYLFMGVIWGASFSSPEADPDREIVECYQASTDTFTIVRAQESTSAKEWPVGSNFMLTATGGVFEEIEAEITLRATTNHIMGEIPSETPNGSVTNFSTANVFEAGKIRVYLNGLLQRAGASYDYEEDGDENGVTFTSAGTPQTGDIVSFDYIKA